MILLKFFFCLSALTLGAAYAEDDDGRIVNGQRMHISQAPYLIQIRRNGQLHCGGSMIASDVVLTAAHCVVGFNTAEMVIIYSATTVREVGIQRTIKQVCIHPEYKPDTMYSDVAVLKLNAPIPSCKTVGLCEHELSSTDSIQVSGWGQLVEGGATAQTLQTVSLPLRSYTDCQREFGQFVKQDMFCASGLSQVGSCRGDSGGPAISRGQVCGLVSFSYKCGQVGHMDAYTSVLRVKPIIKQCMAAFD